MTNLHRDLAPISAAAWAEIEEEASRTFKRHVAGRRVVDVEDRRVTILPVLRWVIRFRSVRLLTG